MLKKKKYRPTGFTLIELLVVVLIIGVLAAIALPQYKLVVGKTKFATLKDNARAIRNALDRYYLANSVYTTSLENLDIEIKMPPYCHIAAADNPMIMCYRIIFGSQLSFMLGYDYRQHRQACFILTNITSQYANKLCQTETGKLTPEEDSSAYKAYYY